MATLAFWFFVMEPIVEHSRWEQRVSTGIRLLREKRPPDVTPPEWEHVVGWTQTLHANWGGVHQTIAVNRHEKWQFLEAFERRLESRVDLTIIDWIWDEYLRITKMTKQYDGHRPTRYLRSRAE